MDALDLSGTWSIRYDPLSQGRSDRWHLRPPADGWKDIPVPSAWQSVLGINANGVAYYRRAIPPEAVGWAKAGSRVRLRFQSVATDAHAWINGVEVGRHMGDWIPFEFDITDALMRAEAEPVLIVRVDQVHAPRPAKGVVTENGHITKGFHDVLSAQHAGIWGPVSLRRTGPTTIPPNGLWVDADAAAQRLTIRAELDGVPPAKPVAYDIRDPDCAAVAQGELSLRDGVAGAVVDVPRSALWSPASPRLHQVRLRFADDESLTQRFGFRTIETGGPGNSLILLNGQPIQIRGLLSWGHEPRHIAPAPPPAQIRAEFAAALDRGFNCVCLCMFYPLEDYFDIADEMGVLLWQEHAVWKSRMTPDTLAEYRRVYEAFMRRDRRHASVVIVSGTCEHDSYDEGLGKWWWETSGRMVPRALRQIQTGFLEWTPPDQTHAYDDHVYDNCGRWVRFVEDMQARIEELPPKPFIMGETIISNAWPDVDALRQAGAAEFDPERLWWLSKGLDECAAYEVQVTRRLGDGTLDRFKLQADRWGKQHRKFQAEVLRTMPRSAGFVTNSIRDVPICRLGLMDDLDRWRFAPEDVRPWFGDVVLLLRTPRHLRAFDAGGPIRIELGVSNFGSGPFERTVKLSFADQQREVRLAAAPGELSWATLDITVPAAADEPRPFEVAADAGDGLHNRWSLVALPPPAKEGLAGIARLGGSPFSPQELAPEFEERSYSSGWGLPCRTWRPRRQEPADLRSIRPEIAPDQPVPDNTRAVLTHRLTPRLRDYLESGGRIVLLAGPHAGGIGSKWINLWGLLPLIAERDDPAWPVQPGGSDAILAMLLHDLTASTTRAVPVDELGLTDHIDPIIRYVWTHDSGIPRNHDPAFAARVGQGLLVVSTLDHITAAGAWMLRRLLRLASTADLKPAERELDVATFVAG
jgi:hypothetical protein